MVYNNDGWKHFFFMHVTKIFNCFFSIGFKQHQDRHSFSLFHLYPRAGVRKWLWSPSLLLMSLEQESQGVRVVDAAGRVVSSWQHVADLHHVDGWIRKARFPIRIPGRLMCSNCFTGIWGGVSSMSSTDPCSLFPLASTPNGMIWWSRVGRILDTWPAQQRRGWKW